MEKESLVRRESANVHRCRVGGEEWWVSCGVVGVGCGVGGEVVEGELLIDCWDSGAR